jgi:sulfite exporter TauE/SafE
MHSEMFLLMGTAITLACLHTGSGPDHYLPFIALSKSRGWSFRRTLMWTTICGCGHVWSSVLLGLGAAVIGWSLSKVGWLQVIRGGVAGWFMLLFGIGYSIWGLYRAYKNKPHKHFDMYEGGEIYVYQHKHGQAVQSTERYKVTPWVMFIIFLMGPCEPMIPLLCSPAIAHSKWGLAILIIVYTCATLLTMLVMVTLGYLGIAFVKTEKIHRYVHALGGLTLFICGLGMVFMSW